MSFSESDSSSTATGVKPCRDRQATDSHFDSGELLFRRVLLGQFDQDGHVYPQAFIPDPVSVNRSRYSTALCVICASSCVLRKPSVDYKPVKMNVSALLKQPTIVLKHIPSPKNSSHCEIDSVENTRQARKVLRTHLSDHSHIVTNFIPCESFLAKM